MEAVQISDTVAIKQSFKDVSAFQDWKSAYLAAKRVFSDPDAVNDPVFMRDAMELTLRLGLSYEEDGDCYLDAIRLLSVAYIQLGEYEEALNCLQTTLEYIPDSPDWVFHDVVFAQNHTPDIERNLRNPTRFLDDLAHNDSGDMSVRQKQQNIFKHFLANAIVFLAEHPGAKVEMHSLEEAARLYQVIGTDVWETFCKASRNEIDEKMMARIHAFLQHAEEESGKGKVKDPAIIALFSGMSDQVDEPGASEKELLQRLEAVEEELKRREEELRRAGIENEEMVKANDSLKQIVEKYENDMEDYRAEIERKDIKQQEIQEELDRLHHGAEEHKELRDEYKKEKHMHSELKDRFVRTEKELKKARELNKEKDEEIEKERESKQEAIRERDKLKEERTRRQSGDEWADLFGQYTAFVVIAASHIGNWLDRKLRTVGGDWWSECVMAPLNAQQSANATTVHYTMMGELDLAALIKVFKYNWRNLRRQGYLPNSVFDNLNRMSEIRNGWAHISIRPIEKERLAANLKAMSLFLVDLGCDHVKRSRMERFASELTNE